MLTERDWDQILSASWSLGDMTSEEELALAALNFVFDFVGGEEAHFGKLDAGKISGITYPNVGLANDLPLELASIVNEHPIVSHLASSNYDRPIRISDILRFCQFERTRIYQVLYRPRAIRFQLTVPLQIDRTYGSGITYNVNRSGSDFSDGDISRMIALQPVLAAHHAARQARQPTITQRDELRSRLGLTHREVEILALIAAGLTAVSIGHRLRISPRTVRKHAENIYAKLDIHSRIEVINYCRAIGLLSSDYEGTTEFNTSSVAINRINARTDEVA